jgi:hypothetical protein
MLFGEFGIGDSKEPAFLRGFRGGIKETEDWRGGLDCCLRCVCLGDTQQQQTAKQSGGGSKRHEISQVKQVVYMIRP